MKAINKRHQSMVNRAVKWIEKYNKANEQRDIALELMRSSMTKNAPIWRKYNRLCERAFDKYLECLYELPRREVAQIEKADLY